MRRIILSGFLLWATVTASATSTSSGAASGVWIIHATDPHLYVDKTPEPPPASSTEAPAQKVAREQRTNQIKKQRALNEEALRDLMERAMRLSGSEAKPRLLVLTGDFDADPCRIADAPEAQNIEDRDKEDRGKILECTDDARLPKPKADAKKSERDNQVKTLGSILATSTVPDIYIVPGDNDIAREAATIEAATYFSTFIADVQKNIVEAGKSSVRLHNLSSCYTGGADAECFADVPDRVSATVS